MSVVALRAVPAPAEVGWQQRLRETVRAEFAVDRYEAVTGDPHLFGYTCSVEMCDYAARYTLTTPPLALRICPGHQQRWNRREYREVAPEEWVAAQDSLKYHVQRCAAPSCRRSRRPGGGGLCGAHHGRTHYYGMTVEEVIAEDHPVEVGDAPCSVPGCTFVSAPMRHGPFAEARVTVCDTHRSRLTDALKRHQREGGTAFDFPYDRAIDALADSASSSQCPTYELRHDCEQVTWELRYALQQWHDGAHNGSAVGRWKPLRRGLARFPGVTSLTEIDHTRPGRGRLDCELRWAIKQIEAFVRVHGATPNTRHDDVWHREVFAHLHTEGRPLPTRFDFTAISQPWLRELAKRFVWHRVSVDRVTLEDGRCELRHLRDMSAWAGEGLADERSIDREFIENYFALDLTDGRKRRLTLAGFLDVCRARHWATFHPSAVVFRGELRRERRRKNPRPYSQREIQQIDDPSNVSRIESEVVLMALLIMRHCALRVSSVVMLDRDCLIYDNEGTAYLAYLDVKGGHADQVIIPPHVARLIEGWVKRMDEHYPDSTVLLPGIKNNPLGRARVQTGFIRTELKKWVEDCGIINDRGGPLEIQPHRFRHHKATELINDGVSLVAVQMFLSQESPDMTLFYAKLLNSTAKEQLLKHHERVNTNGEIKSILSEGVSDDSLWIKGEIARATQIAQGGYCGLPLQQDCEYHHACYVCAHWTTDVAFIPTIDNEIEQTARLITLGEKRGNRRVIEKNVGKLERLRSIRAGLDELAAKRAAEDQGPLTLEVTQHG